MPTLKELKVGDAPRNVALWRIHAGKALPTADTVLSAAEARLACLIGLVNELKFVRDSSASLVISQLSAFIAGDMPLARLSFRDRSSFCVIDDDKAGDLIDLTSGAVVVPQDAGIESLAYNLGPYCAKRASGLIGD